MHSERFSSIVERVGELLDEHKIPGAAIGVWHDGEIETAGLGVTSLAHPLPVTAETLFQTGSITKTFVSTALMRLVERGELELDLPLRTYLPELRLRDPEAQERATLRHLLTHTGGWLGDFFDDMGWGDDALRRMVEERVPELPQELPLGTTFSYNNAGFYLAGRVLELITGQSFEEALGTLVLQPLGLAQSLFFPDDVMLCRFAVGHIQREQGPELARPWSIGRAAHAAGGLASSVGDLLTYAQAHVSGANPALLAAESLSQMQTPLVSSVSILDHVGLSWFMRELDGVRVINHGGATNGQIAALWVVPARNFALATLTNAGNGGLLTRAVALQVLHAYLDLNDPEPVPAMVPAERLLAYCGRYVGALSDTLVELGDEGLTLQVLPKGGFPKPDSLPAPAPPLAPLALYADTLAVVSAGPLQGSRCEFGDWVDGRASWLRFGGRARLRAHERSESR